MRKLPRLAEQLDESERKVPDRGEGGGRLWEAADALYRGYLKLEWESKFFEWESKFSGDIDVPCLTWEDARETLMFFSAKRGLSCRRAAFR